MREPPDRINHAGWSSGNYLVLRAISRRITRHADGSLKGQMAWTGRQRDEFGHGNAGCTSSRRLIECTSELGCTPCWNKESEVHVHGQAGQGAFFSSNFLLFPLPLFFILFQGPSSLSTQGTFIDSLSPSPVPLPACLPPENLLVYFGACPHVTLLLPLASSFLYYCCHCRIDTHLPPLWLPLPVEKNLEA